MKCEVCSFDSTADPVLLKCTGCPRVFHAACVGLNLQRNSLRSKKADFDSFLLPCCESCQELVQAKLNYGTIVEQHKHLTELLHINTEETHRIALHHEKPNIIHDAVEGLEILLQAIKLEISALSKNSSLASNVTSIKNHVSSLIDTAILSSKECMSTALESVTSIISSDMHNIHDELNHLQQLTVEIAANCTMTSNPVLELDILDELKSLSANLATVRCTEPSPPTPEYPSLEVELNKNIDVSGWRFLGTKKVWKADWSEYDARQLRRNEQQKIADNARKRKNRQQRAYNSRNRCN